MIRLAASAALTLFGSTMPAAAHEWDEGLFIQPRDQRSVVFFGVEGGRSVFVSGGSKQAVLGSLDRSGFLLSETGGFGITRERLASGAPATRLTTQASALAGQQWVRPGLYTAAYLGPNLEHEQLTVAGRVSKFSKPRYGLKAQGELWANPTPETLFTATVVGITDRLSVWARTSAGIRIWRGLFAGPEVVGYATDTYREIRVGGHLTGLKAWLVEGRLSAGWMVADDRRPGSPYIGASAWIRM